jgi:hypothetical protein
VVGIADGKIVGFKIGEEEGVIDGLLEVMIVGRNEGNFDGVIEGSFVGDFEGPVGEHDGDTVGPVGLVVGFNMVGTRLRELEGIRLGDVVDGNLEGQLVDIKVGEG